MLNKLMPHPLLISSQSDYLIQVVGINSHIMTNSADLGQLASEEANRSGSTLFAKAGYIWDQQDQGLAMMSLHVYKFSMKVNSTS